MKHPESEELLRSVRHIYAAAKQSSDGNRCMVAPDPQARERILKALNEARENAEPGIARSLRFRQPQPPGFNDGLIYPGDAFPVGTSARVVRSAALDRAPLAGTVRVAVVLVQFSDKPMTASTQHFHDLFFSTGVIASGSVKEYFKEVTNGIIDLTGEVVGPYTLPRTIVEYANGDSGTGNALPNARTMARDAATAADPDINFAPYDNDGDGFVDAFVVIHAGPGAESTLNPNDIWSHKWVLSGSPLNADGTKIFAYLTVPEDARIGVCAHELGHLVFGFPDLYDTDSSGEGVGNWCLMGGGSWNNHGDTPAHPSAWCKANQGWATVDNRTGTANVSIADVKDSHTIYRMWKNGTGGNEYFLVENRQKNRFDAHLPAEGLLIWHIDEAIATNSDENHPKVALMQADGKRDLEKGNNRGDGGDVYPGSSGNTSFNQNSTPNSKSYGNADTCVSVTNISASGAVMTARLSVECITKNPTKDSKDIKDLRKDKLEKEKERKEFLKDRRKDAIKEKEFKEKEFKEIEKRPEKPDIDKSPTLDKGFGDTKFTDGKFVEGPGGRPFGSAASGTHEQTTWEQEVEARLSALEAQAGAQEPFIDESLRPDLRTGALAGEEDVQHMQRSMATGAAQAKREFDTKQRDT